MDMITAQERYPIVHFAQTMRIVTVQGGQHFPSISNKAYDFFVMKMKKQ
jgi:hypothetical protein